jgi:hypothetical protein
MGSPSNYWQLSLPALDGKRQRRLIESAQQYFCRQFSDRIDAVEIVDAPTQRQILADVSPHEFQVPPALSLRCCISDYIYQACLAIVRKFGLGRQSSAQLSIVDLLPIVLNDDGLDPQESLRRRQRSSPEPLAIPPLPLALTILKSWNPDKGSLSTWSNHHVLQHADMTQILAEHGILLISDWAILNDTSAGQLQKILAGMMYQLTPTEVTQSCHLLQSYHAVYREDRLQQRLAGASKTRCQEPTIAQLERMAIELKSTVGQLFEPAEILKQIKTIATQVRQYRIARKGGPVNLVALDDAAVQVASDRGVTDQDEQQVSDFLALYREDFLQCLDQAIATTIKDEFQRLKRRQGGRYREFIRGLELLHCQGLSMSEIAPKIGLEKQYQVSRLLKLDDLRTNIRQRSLRSLRDRVREKVIPFASPTQLISLDQKLDAILDEQLEAVMQAASAESMAPKGQDHSQAPNRQPLKSLLAQRICHYLKAHSCD